MSQQKRSSAHFKFHLWNNTTSNCFHRDLLLKLLKEYYFENRINLFNFTHSILKFPKFAMLLFKVIFNFTSQKKLRFLPRTYFADVNESSGDCGFVEVIKEFLSQNHHFFVASTLCLVLLMAYYFISCHHHLFLLLLVTSLSLLFPSVHCKICQNTGFI